MKYISQTKVEGSLLICFPRHTKHTYGAEREPSATLLNQLKKSTRGTLNCYFQIRQTAQIQKRTTAKPSQDKQKTDVKTYFYYFDGTWKTSKQEFHQSEWLKTSLILK